MSIRVDARTAEIRALCRDAFLEGVKNGGDSAPHDRDHAAITLTMERAFAAWWRENAPAAHRIASGR